MKRWFACLLCLMLALCGTEAIAAKKPKLHQLPGLPFGQKYTKIEKKFREIFGFEPKSIDELIEFPASKSVPMFREQVRVTAHIVTKQGKKGLVYGNVDMYRVIFQTAFLSPWRSFSLDADGPSQRLEATEAFASVLNQVTAEYGAPTGMTLTAIEGGGQLDIPYTDDRLDARALAAIWENEGNIQADVYYGNVKAECRLKTIVYEEADRESRCEAHLSLTYIDELW